MSPGNLIDRHHKPIYGPAVEDFAYALEHDARQQKILGARSLIKTNLPRCSVSKSGILLAMGIGSNSSDRELELHRIDREWALENHTCPPIKKSLPNRSVAKSGSLPALASNSSTREWQLQCIDREWEFEYRASHERELENVRMMNQRRYAKTIINDKQEFLRLWQAPVPRLVGHSRSSSVSRTPLVLEKELVASACRTALGIDKESLEPLRAKCVSLPALLMQSSSTPGSAMSSKVRDSEGLEPSWKTGVSLPTLLRQRSFSPGGALTSKGHDDPMEECSLCTQQVKEVAAKVAPFSGAENFIPTTLEELTGAASRSGKEAAAMSLATGRIPNWCENSQPTEHAKRRHSQEEPSFPTKIPAEFGVDFQRLEGKVAIGALLSSPSRNCEVSSGLIGDFAVNPPGQQATSGCSSTASSPSRAAVLSSGLEGNPEVDLRRDEATGLHGSTGSLQLASRGLQGDVAGAFRGQEGKAELCFRVSSPSRAGKVSSGSEGDFVVDCPGQQAADNGSSTLSPPRFPDKVSGKLLVAASGSTTARSMSGGSAGTSVPDGIDTSHSRSPEDTRLSGANEQKLLQQQSHMLPGNLAGQPELTEESPSESEGSTPDKGPRIAERPIATTVHQLDLSRKVLTSYPHSLEDAVEHKPWPRSVRRIIFMTTPPLQGNLSWDRQPLGGAWLSNSVFSTPLRF